MRRLYELGAFLLGSLGAVLVFYPVGIHRLIRFELWRWWGLLGIAGAVILAHAAARMREISVPDDIEEQIDAAERDGDWEQVWNFRSLQADAARQAGDYEREEWARNKLVDLALEHVEHGVFRALSQLERLRIIAPEDPSYLERTAELLRDLGSQRRLADVLEHELAEHCGADTEREIALRRELADVYAELDWPEQAFDHLDRLIEVDPDGETVEDFVEAAEEAERELEALERLEELRERTEDGDGELYESVLAKLE